MHGDDHLQVKVTMHTSCDLGRNHTIGVSKGVMGPLYYCHALPEFPFAFLVVMEVGLRSDVDINTLHSS